MDPNGNDPNAGVAGVPSPGVGDTASQDGDGSPPAASDGQGGTLPDPRDEELRQAKESIKALNKAVVEARRNSRQTPPNANIGEGDDTFSTPEGQYAAAIQIATGNLRAGLEERVALYPELPAEELQRIRINPWAFASQESFFKTDFETALDEIEQKMLERAEALAEEKKNGQPATPTPATVNGNPAPEAPEGETAAPGSDEDIDPWTMPLDKLEKAKNKEVAKMSQPKQ